LVTDPTPVIITGIPAIPQGTTPVTGEGIMVNGNIGLTGSTITVTSTSTTITNLPIYTPEAGVVDNNNAGATLQLTVKKEESSGDKFDSKDKDAKNAQNIAQAKFARDRTDKEREVLLEWMGSKKIK